MGVASFPEDCVDLGLTNKVVLITGTTAGIGFAIARALAHSWPANLLLPPTAPQ
jgi:FlaA1/EpsC-like NDP-sugar epimerase